MTAMRKFLAVVCILAVCAVVSLLLLVSPTNPLAQLMGTALAQPVETLPTVQTESVPESEAPETTVAPATETTVEVTEPETTVPETTEDVTEPETTVPETTEAPTEATPEVFTLTFVGDCTLGSSVKNLNYQQGFVKTIGEDYRYPFANVINYFENDDFTMLNLEGVLADDGKAANKQHTFRGPTAFVNILTQNSVEAVTLANNHTMDFLEEGYLSTTKTLTDAGVPYVEQDKTLIVTTKSGLTIGIYAVNNDNLNQSEIVSAISQLDANEEIDLVILSAHWGQENTFKANATQKTLGHAAIDAGADIVYGTHTHTLQPIEEYNGGIIYYSLGNFAFGGNNNPKDYNTALVQQEVIRNTDGTVTLGELTIVPCSISSVANRNNFQPTPYEKGTAAYEKAMSKLNGTYTGGSLPIG